MGLDILKYEQTSLFYSVSYLNSRGIGALFRKSKAHQRLPVASGLCGKASVCFLMQLTLKST